MSLPIKLGLGTIALGSAVGAGYGAVTYFSQENKDESINEPQTKSVADLIKEKYEYILLDASLTGANKDSEYWANIWKDYQTKSGNEANPLQLEGWGERGETDFTNKIKEKCSKLASSIILNEEAPDYKNVSNYCSRPVTLADEASNDGHVIIETKDSTNESKEWQPKVDKKQDLTEQLKKLGLSDNDLTATKVREKCRDIATKKKQDNDYKDKLPAYKEICTNPKTTILA